MLGGAVWVLVWASESIQALAPGSACSWELEWGLEMETETELGLVLERPTRHPADYAK